MSTAPREHMPETLSVIIARLTRLLEHDGDGEVIAVCDRCGRIPHVTLQKVSTSEHDRREGDEH